MLRRNGSNVSVSDSLLIHCGDAPLPPVGDVDWDGEISSIDALLVLHFQAGLVSSLPDGLVGAGNAPPPRGDVNENGTVDARDALLILQFVAGLIDTLPP